MTMRLQNIDTGHASLIQVHYVVKHSRTLTMYLHV